jgi:predicted RNA-binding protein with EMAP domain
MKFKGFIMAKKKTYMFSEETIQTLERLKKITNKKETQIISEALDVYLEYLEREKEFNDNLKFMTQTIQELSKKLGACEEKLKHK